MASEADHILLANKNHAALLHLMADPAGHPEWVATIAFYKAVQIVEAVIATDLNQHSTSHHQRLLTLKAHRFKAIFREYRPLLTASRVARYLADAGDRDLDGKTVIDAPAGEFRTFADYVPAADVVNELVNKRLRKLEQAALAFLTPAGRNVLHKL